MESLSPTEKRMAQRVIEGLIVALVAAAASTVATTKVLEERLGNIQRSLDRTDSRVEQLYRDLYRPSFRDQRLDRIHFEGSTMPNLFQLEPLLINRLRDQLPAEVAGDAVFVGSLANLVGREDVAGLCPAVFVSPGPGAVVQPGDDDAEPDDAITMESESWTVLVLVKFVRDSAAFEASFQQAGQLMGAVYSALHGWRAERSYKPMYYAGKQQPEPSERGVMEFAVEFTVVRAFGPDTV